jgi:hypothetical protein
VTWLTPGEARSRDSPEITRMVLDHIEERLRERSRTRPHRPVPFFFVRRGERCVEEL